MTAVVSEPPQRSAVRAKIRSARIPGTLAVAWMLFGGRWAAYIGVSPLFLTDVLLIGGLGWWLLDRVFHPTKSKSGVGTHPALWLILGYTALRFLFGANLSINAIRDSAPYFYAVAGIVAGAAVVQTGMVGRDRTARILIWALGLHALWVFATVVVDPDLPNHMPIVSPEQGLHIFKTRTDFEGSLVAIFASWITIRLLRNDFRRPLLGIVLVAACWVTIFAQGSRAALLGALVIGLVSATAALRAGTVTFYTRAGILLALPLLLTIIVAVLPSTTAGQRLGDTFGGRGETVSTSAAGTTRARERTWIYLYHYATDEPKRFLFGVGYGPNFMSETQAGYLLTRSSEDIETNPRAPHNYELNTLLRGGLLALLLFLWLALATGRAVVRAHRRMAQDDFLYLVAIIPVAIFIPATLGVVLESPFGAIPFFWSAGILLQLMRGQTLEVPRA